MTRRRTHVSHDVVYAAVGASAAPDLLRFPPQDSTAFARELQLGSGSDRFLTASTVLMTWGAFRAAGFQVTELELGDGGQYSGVLFTAEGTPELVTVEDQQYGPDGTPFVTAGTVVKLELDDDQQSRQSRVVYVVAERRRSGFALGSADDAGVIGEIAFTVEHRADDTVWAQTRGFLWAPESGLLGIKAKSALRGAMQHAEQIIAALAPGAATLEAAGNEE